MQSCSSPASSSLLYTLQPLAPLGAVVSGIDLRDQPSAAAIAGLICAAANHGFLVFRNVSLPGASLEAVSSLFGSVIGRHIVHEEAVSDNVLRLSNDESRGVFGVGPQWHSDGSFERRIFSHVLFHAQQMPEGGGGGTELADLVAAFAACLCIDTVREQQQ